MSVDVRAIAREVASKYPAVLTQEQCGLITNEVAWRASRLDPNWGLSKKTEGKRSRLPNGVEIAEDIVHYRVPSEGAPFGQLYDILAGAPERNDPVFNPQVYHNDPSGRPWLPPFDPATFAQTAPTPAPPVPAGPSLADVMARLDALAARLDLLAHNSTLTAEGVQRLEAALRDGIPLRLRAKILGDVTGTVGGRR